MKKKMLSLLLALVMVLAMVPAPAFAADSGFTIENGVLTKYTGPGGDVVIPNSVTTIGEGAFGGCTGLTSVTIPNSVTAIGSGAFYGCTGLTSVTIPNSVTVIDEVAFRGCTGLTAIEVDAGNQSYASVDGVLFTKDMKTLMAYPGGKKGAYAIPNSVTTIGGWAFSGCTSLTSVTIPNSVTEIWNFAFEDCTGLTSVTIPNSVTVIDEAAFRGCTGLTSVTIPSSVTEIWDFAFADCTGLTSVTIPNSVTEIWGGVFSGCTGLKDVYYGGTEAQWTEIEGEFRDDLTSATIHFNSTGTSTPEQPASWAKADVDRAIAANILPAELRGAYGQPATFTDTTDPAVLRMASVGVVTGVGNGAFNPNGQLNREQAATMLARLAAALGKPLADSEPTFADSGSVSGWAKAAVGQMQKSGIMGGTGNNLFSPAGSYTREQSTVTIMRLYDQITV